jgi:predicted  nucleic acid-binding Zn-ribbon protein
MSEEPVEAPPAHLMPLQQLLIVQEHDLALDRLRHRRSHLPEREALSRVDRDLAGLSTRLEQAGSEQASLAGRQAELEKAIDATNARVGVIEKQLYGDRNVAFRDQQAMAAEVTSLKERRSQLEEDEIAVMEELEPVDAHLAELKAQRDAVAGERERLRSAIAMAEGVLDGEMAAVDTVRGHAVSGLPEDLFAEYEKLRARFGGIGVSRLVGGSCSGCHLTLPATELDHIRHASLGDRFHCDQCGRLLVP